MAIMPTMTTYDALERQQQALMDQIQKQKEQCIDCPVCSSQWFTEIEASRYQLDHNVILGQDVPTEPNTVPYKLLKCLRCDNLLEPRVLHNTRDAAGGTYDHFLDTLQGKGDTRDIEKEPGLQARQDESKDEIPSQRL